MSSVMFKSVLWKKIFKFLRKMISLEGKKIIHIHYFWGPLCGYGYSLPLEINDELMLYFSFLRNIDYFTENWLEIFYSFAFTSSNLFAYCTFAQNSNTLQLWENALVCAHPTQYDKWAVVLIISQIQLI